MFNKIIIFFALSGLAGQGWCAGLETLRSADLSSIDAGAITVRVQDNQLPQPSPVLLAAGQPVQKYISSSDLRDLLNDPNPKVRKAAVRSSRPYILNSYAQDPVLEILQDRNEPADIRVEAARVLSYATGAIKVRDALTDIIRDSNEPPELRVMAYKALWTVAGTSRIQDLLMDAARYDEKDPEARLAAIWALFPVAGNSRPQGILMDLVRSGNQEDPVRIEAMKSLYGAMGNSRVKDEIMDIARDGREEKPVRLTAIKALSASNGDSRVKDLLEDMMRTGQDLDLRAAAIEAAAPNMAEIREYFHLGYRIENGIFISPIEKE